MKHMPNHPQSNHNHHKYLHYKFDLDSNRNNLIANIIQSKKYICNRV